MEQAQPSAGVVQAGATKTTAAHAARLGLAYVCMRGLAWDDCVAHQRIAK